MGDTVSEVYGLPGTGIIGESPSGCTVEKSFQTGSDRGLELPICDFTLHGLGQLNLAIFTPSPVQRARRYRSHEVSCENEVRSAWHTAEAFKVFLLFFLLFLFLNLGDILECRSWEKTRDHLKRVRFLDWEAETQFGINLIISH